MLSRVLCRGAVQGCSGSCLPLGGVRVLSRVLSAALLGCSGSCLPLGGVRVLPKVLSPRNTKILSGFGELGFNHFGAKFGHLGPCSNIWEATGDLEGKLGYREVMFKLSWGYVMLCCSYMSDFVRPCCWFCIQKCSPPSRTKILSGFLRAMLAPFGVK